MRFVCAKCSAGKSEKVYHSEDSFTKDISSPRGFRSSCFKWDYVYLREGRKSDSASNLEAEVRADRFDKNLAALFLKTAFWYNLKL